MAIQSFSDPAVQEFFEKGKIQKRVRWWSVKKVVLRKLDMLHYSLIVDDLRSPPGNRLEKLKGDLKGMYSIRVNEQWRIVFVWTEHGPSQVRVIDYHK